MFYSKKILVLVLVFLLSLQTSIFATEDNHYELSPKKLNAFLLSIGLSIAGTTYIEQVTRGNPEYLNENIYGNCIIYAYIVFLVKFLDYACKSEKWNQFFPLIGMTSLSIFYSLMSNYDYFRGKEDFYFISMLTSFVAILLSSFEAFYYLVKTKQNFQEEVI